MGYGAGTLAICSGDHVAGSFSSMWEILGMKYAPVAVGAAQEILPLYCVRIISWFGIYICLVPVYLSGYCAGAAAYEMHDFS